MIGVVFTLGGWEEGEGEEGIAGALRDSRGGWGGCGRSHPSVVLTIVFRHCPHPFGCSVRWCLLCCAPGSVGGVGGCALEFKLLKDRGAVAADLMCFDVQVLGGLADGVACLEE